MFRRRIAVLGAALALSCGSSESTETPPVAAAPVAPPPPLEPIAAVETDARKVALGRSLFFDTRLSGDGTLSCATCHSFDHGGAEPRRTSTGIRGQTGPINAPTVLNSGFNFVQFWDGRAADLEAQAAGPVANPLEMGASWDDVVARLSGDEALRAQFTAIYGESGVTQANVTDAIAEYERYLVTPSRFDRFLRGEAGALTEEEFRGYGLFTTVGCASCHRGPNVGGTMYQRLGVVRDYFSERGTPETDADQGRFNVTHDEADRHRFKVPTLRNVALTSPYFHDGSRETLDDAVRAMGRYQLGRELDADQVRSLVAFLGSLTGEMPPDSRPAGTAGTGEQSPTAPTDPASAAPTP